MSGSQWPAVVGTLVGSLGGAGLGIASTWSLERRRWDRQRRERGEEARRKLYGDYIGRMNAMFDAFQEMNDTVNRATSPLSDEEASILYRPTKLCAVECASTLGEIRLVSSKEVVEISNRWFDGRRILLEAACRTFFAEGWREAVDRWSDDRDNFTAVARAELGSVDMD